MNLIEKYTTERRKFKFGANKRYLGVYDNKGYVKGLIWNVDRVIYMDGDEVIASNFFK